MRLQEMRRTARVWLTGAGLALMATGATAEEYLCTTSPTSTADIVARSILLDIRQNIVALVYDEHVQAAYGAPIPAEVTESSPKWLKLSWKVGLQAFERGSRGLSGTNFSEPVFYFATLDKVTLAFRVRAKAAGVVSASAEGKCVRKKP